jgi:hypothetical protein
MIEILYYSMFKKMKATAQYQLYFDFGDPKRTQKE